MFRVLIGWIGVLAGLGTASAHTGFDSETEVRIYSDRMDVCVRTTFALGWKMMGNHAPADVGEAGREAAKPFLTQLAPGLFDVGAAGSVMKPKKVNCVFELDEHIAFLLTYDRPPGWPLVLTARYFDHVGSLDSGTIKIFDQTDAPYQRDIEPVVGKILFRNDPALGFAPAHPPAAGSAESPPPPEKPVPPGFGGYFKLGIHHIAAGHDHLLFLLALLLGCRAMRPMLIIVTAFTVAHSLTLALAALGWVNLPDRWVEASIALSIIWVGIGNLRGKTGENGRAWLTFAFGLIHGLGFASVLKGIGLGAGGQAIVPPLLAFNLGVETGQLAIVVVALPVLLALRKQAFFTRYGNPALSVLVLVAGTVWFFQRVFA